MANRIMFQVSYFDGIQWVTRVVVGHAAGSVFMVYDRYDDGSEYMITRRDGKDVQRTFPLSEAVNLLESVMM